MTNVRFEDCRFAGIFGFGVATNAHFLRCGWAGPSIGTSRKGSKNVVFEECKFVGETSDPNHRGGVGSDGEAKFIRCTAKWFTLEGYEKLELLNCELDTCNIDTDSVGNSGENFSYSSVLIDNCKLRGKFDMVANSLQSLTIRDTVIDNLDLSGASVKGDVVMERVKGGSVKAIVRGAHRLIVKNCQFTPQPGVRFAFSLASNEAQEILVEDTSITCENILVDIGGGAQTESITFNRSKFTRLDLKYVHTQKLLLKEFEANSVVLSDARIGLLEFDQASFAYTLDLSNTQVKNFKQTGGTSLKKLAGLKLDGSNVKIN